MLRDNDQQMIPLSQTNYAHLEFINPRTKKILSAQDRQHVFVQGRKFWLRKHGEPDQQVCTPAALHNRQTYRYLATGQPLEAGKIPSKSELWGDVVKDDKNQLHCVRTGNVYGDTQAIYVNGQWISPGHIIIETSIANIEGVRGRKAIYYLQPTADQQQVVQVFTRRSSLGNYNRESNHTTFVTNLHTSQLIGNEKTYYIVLDNNKPYPYLHVSKLGQETRIPMPTLDFNKVSHVAKLIDNPLLLDARYRKFFLDEQRVSNNHLLSSQGLFARKTQPSGLTIDPIILAFHKRIRETYNLPQPAAEEEARPPKILRRI